MYIRYFVAVSLLLTIAIPQQAAYAGGVVTVCDEAHLLTALEGGGLVTFTCSGTIELMAEIDISADSTIDGTGQDVTISGNDAVRVFTVTPGAALNLNRLTVAEGKADMGGGIFILPCDGDCGDTTVTVDNSTLSGNSASGSGGGIYVSPYYDEFGGDVVVSVNNSTFSGNSANGGGAIYHDGDYDTQVLMLIVNDSTFSQNVGGVISIGIQAELTIGGGTFLDNSGNVISTALFGLSTVWVDRSTFSGNSGNGIHNLEDNTVAVSNSTFSGNSGCGIVNWDTGLTVSHSSFYGNRECGILNGDDQGTTEVVGSTFTNNGDMGGDIINDVQGTMTVANSTFFGADGSNSGGISNSPEGLFSVSNSTFYGVPIINTMDYGGTLILRNTIIADGPTGGACTGPIADGGGNLSFPDSTCPGINVDPLLGPLQDNGGPTLTMEPGPGSPAVDAGDNATCQLPPVNGIDQRRVLRPVGPHCDIGAVEVNYLPWRRWLPVTVAR